ncbi:MAG TPA: 4Fe-4S binding protein [Candidatus Pacearchaeota archaeon]|nr:4Fe-4S binding protein [Candidatus Pacearchaeota archaeon]
MAVLINFKICDNAKECSGIAVCKTGALFWDGKRKSVSIDNSKCVSCGACEKACMVGAIRVAKNSKEHAKIKKEIDNDPRKIADLWADRYGAQPVHPAFLEEENNFNLEKMRAGKICVIEIFNDDSIMCLLHSIPVKDLFGDFNVDYLKLKISSNDFLKKYKIAELPALLFFKNRKLLGKIEGYYDISGKPCLEEAIKKILK